MRRISVSLGWDPQQIDDFLALARTADEAGVETLWVNEGFGHDAFSRPGAAGAGDDARDAGHRCRECVFAHAGRAGAALRDDR